MHKPPLLIPLLALVSVAFIAPSKAQTNAYDLVGKMIAPMVNPFLEKPATKDVAFRAVLVLEDVSNKEIPIRGSLTVSVERPDKARLEGAFGEMKVTLCRNGDRLWISPGSQIEALMDKLPKGEKRPKAKLVPMVLPVSDTEAALLPALLAVKALGPAEYAGRKCQVVDAALAPELAKRIGAGARGWSARLWLDADDSRPVRAGVRGPTGSAVIRVESLEYAASLPSATWEPEGLTDVAELKPDRFFALVSALLSMVPAASAR